MPSLSWHLNFPSSRSLCRKCPFHIPKSTYFSKSTSNTSSSLEPSLKKGVIFWIQISCFPYLLVFTNGVVQIWASFDACKIWSSTEIYALPLVTFAAVLRNFYDVTGLHLFATFNGRLFSIAKSEKEITALGRAFQNHSTLGFRNIFKEAL